MDSDIKYIFVLQLPEDNTKNYVGMLSNTYQYSSFSIQIKSKYLTLSVMNSLKKAFLNIGITPSTEIVVSNTITNDSPIFLFLSLVRKFIPYKFNSVAIEKAFKRITAYHTSYSIGREFTIKDYNKLYKNILRNNDCQWISSEIDTQLNNTSKAYYRIQKIIRICMYYMCIKNYFLSSKSK